MLSSSYTLADVKARLTRTYDYYGYDSSESFDSVLTMISEDVYRTMFLPRLGTTEYARIAAKNRVSLNTLETNLYWAEVFSICYEFLEHKSAEDGQLQEASDESLTVEGYTHRISSGGGSGRSAGESSRMKFYEKMYTYWKLAGYNISSIQRTCDIFSGGNEDDTVLDIIE